jgi:hypothetical protein
MVAPERRFGGVALEELVFVKMDPEPWRGELSSFFVFFFFLFEFFPMAGGDVPGFHIVN